MTWFKDRYWLWPESWKIWGRWSDGRRLGGEIGRLMVSNIVTGDVRLMPNVLGWKVGNMKWSLLRALFGVLFGWSLRKYFWTFAWKHTWVRPWKGIACSPLPQNNGNLPLPFFGGEYPIILLDNMYSWSYLYIDINWFNWITILNKLYDH